MPELGRERLSLFARTQDLVDAVGATIIIVLGIFIALVRPRTRVSIALAGFACSYGLWSLAFNVFSADHAWKPYVIQATVPWGIATSLFVARLAWLVPRPLEPARRRLALWALAAAPLGWVVFGSLARRVTTIGLGDAAGSMGLVFALVLLALRFPTTADDREAGQIATVSAALALQPGLAVGTALQIAGLVGALLSAAVMVLLASIWLAHTRIGGDRGRTARNLALGLLGVSLLGAVLTATVGNVEGAFGVARVVMVVLLSYAILRHQLLGLDVTAKWTLKQSTVAAAFVGLFFVVSESTAYYLSDKTGAYLGIAAAGLLMFAIAPLQRVAERIANRAMPGVKPIADMTHVERLNLYRQQLRIAWSDGRLLAKERRMLSAARAKLGITDADALRVEDELGH